jgi:hypothetical protein
MIEWIFAILVFYLLYKLIFDFIVPVSRASSQIRSRVNEMNSQYSQQKNRQQQPYPQAQKPVEKTNIRPATDDYIDFEEIK